MLDVLADRHFLLNHQRPYHSLVRSIKVDQLMQLSGRGLDVVTKEALPDVLVKL